MKLLTLILVIFALQLSSQIKAQDKWQIADRATIRLKPSKFSQLPKNIVSYLERLGCTIPQTYMVGHPHNVIRGEFARRGQSDWAVLCSRKGVSSILVFWNGSTKSIAEIARNDDNIYLQTIDGAGNIGFSRAIVAVGRNHIINHYRQFGEKRPPPIKHQGIEDAFVEKASSIHYFYKGQWLELQGMD